MRAKPESSRTLRMIATTLSRRRRCPFISSTLLFKLLMLDDAATFLHSHTHSSSNRVCGSRHHEKRFGKIA